MTLKIFQNFLLLFLINCGNVENSNLDITTNFKNKMKIDETFVFSINEASDSIKVFNRTNLIYNNKNRGKKSIEIDLKNFRLGKNNLKVISYHKSTIKSKNIDFIVLNDKTPEIYDYKIINTYPHQINAYTQGLEFNNGYLYESTGKYGKSKLKKVNFKTGDSFEEVSVSNKYFAEGITIIDNKIIQLTWRENTGLIYNLQTLELVGDFKYNKSKEGWGL